MASSFVFLVTCLLVLPSALAGASKGNALLSGQSLKRNEYLEIGNCRLVLEDDCDLALYDYSKANSYYFIFGHFFVKPTWEYTIDPKSYDPNCVLKLKDDGDLRLYNNDNEQKDIWQSQPETGNQYNKGTYILVLDSDCDVGIYGPTSLQKYVNK